MKRFVVAFVTASFLLTPAAFAGGKDLFEKKCTRCHGASKTEERKGKVKEYWGTLVERMQKKRSNFIPDAEAAEISAWLKENYGA